MFLFLRSLSQNAPGGISSATMVSAYPRSGSATARTTVRTTLTSAAAIRPLEHSMAPIMDLIQAIMVAAISNRKLLQLRHHRHRNPFITTLELYPIWLIIISTDGFIVGASTISGSPTAEIFSLFCLTHSHTLSFFHSLSST